MRDMLRNVLVIGLFLAGSGYVLTEVVLTLVLPLVSVRALVFVLMALICWFLLDNITLAQDLALATQSTSTDGERHLLRSLAFANRKRELAHSLLKDESAAHRETARQLDLLLEQSNRAKLTALHWSLLASKVIVMVHVPKIPARRPAVRSYSSELY